MGIDVSPAQSARAFVPVVSERRGYDEPDDALIAFVRALARRQARIDARIALGAVVDETQH